MKGNTMAKSHKTFTRTGLGGPDPFTPTEGQQRRIDERGHNELTIEDLRIIKKMRDFVPPGLPDGHPFHPDPLKRGPKR